MSAPLDSPGAGRAAHGSFTAAAAATSGAGAAIVATAAAACCATPALAVLTVSILGASGAAWAAGLQPYASWFLAASTAAIGYGFWTRQRASRARSTGVVPPPSTRERLAQTALWLAAAIWLAAVATNLWLQFGGRP